MGDIEIVSQAGVAGAIIFIVLTKVVEMVKSLSNGKSSNRPTQSEMCKEHHAQLMKATDEHGVSADKNWRDAFKLLRNIDNKTKEG